MESNIKIHDGAVKDLSKQYLLSCNTDGWSCRGGWWAHNYHWNKPSELEAGAVYETAFPYVARDDPCKSSLTHHEKNGDFENGPAGWVEYSSNGWDLILPAASLLVTPHSGNWVVWLGGDDDEISYIQQQVTVPSGNPYLAYWHWIASEDLCGYDFGGVIINSTVVDVYNLCSSANTGGWVKHVVNLSAYAGQSVSLQIRAETDDSLNSNLFVDDVSFQASASSAKNSPTLFDLTNAMPKSGKIIPRDVEKEKGTDREFLLRPQSRTTNEKVQGKCKNE